MPFEHQFLILTNGSLVLFFSFEEGGKMSSIREIELDGTSYTSLNFSHLASNGVLLGYAGGVKFYDCRSKNMISLIQSGNALSSFF